MENICGGTAPIVDTYWQTETGSFLLTPLPGAHAVKPGAASYPFFGVAPVILDDKGVELKVREGPGEHEKKTRSRLVYGASHRAGQLEET
jgi:acetyl-CoA synthetase